MKRTTAKIIGTSCVVATLATSLWLTPKIALRNDISNTRANVTNNQEYIEELNRIEDDLDVVFENKELLEHLKKLRTELTIRDLRNIKKVDIPNTLTDTNLSDLKYLINLETLHIKDNEIDLSDIKYNSKLTNLSLSGCKVKNNEDIPNSVKYLSLINSYVEDNKFVVPYDTTNLSFSNTTVSNVVFKNPTNPNIFYFSGNTIFDLENIKDCSNINSLTLIECPNIKNGSVLSNFKDIEHLTIDDYSPIWLTFDTFKTLNNLEEEQKEQLKKEIRTLDKIAKSLVPFEMEDYEKVNKIVRNVMSRVTYDKNVLEKIEGYEALISMYEKQPIYHVLNGEDGICTNYACLFTALANRVGLENYLQQNDLHSWNLVKEDNKDTYSSYDTVELDKNISVLKDEQGNPIINEERNSLYYLKHYEEDRLYYYDFDYEKINSDNYEAPIELRETTDKDFTLGYINPNTIDRKNAKELARIKTILIEVLILEAIALFLKATETIKELKEDIKEFKTKKFN